ncbi:Phospholipase D beta 1 [Asimina triloba]
MHPEISSEEEEKNKKKYLLLILSSLIFYSPPPPLTPTPSDMSKYVGRLLSAGGSSHGPGHQQQHALTSRSSLKVVLLHGSLDVWILQANNLPNMDGFSDKLNDMFGKVLSGTKLDIAASHKITSDPYVSITVAGATVGRTFVVENTENPVWNQHFCVPVAHYAADVRFVVKDDDVVGSQLIGSVSIPAQDLYSSERIEGTFAVLSSGGKPVKNGASLSVAIQYIPIEKQSSSGRGVGSAPDYCGVPGTYFPLRRGGRVTLYQDAHVPDGCLPNLELDRGIRHEHGKCWHGIFDAISQARRLIYITGWSVYSKVTLVRDGGRGSGVTLGELLKTKSQEGVRVLLLLWDDPTSKNLGVIRTAGIMGTHDEETRQFFKHSSVQVLLCPRSAGKKHSLAKQQEVGAIYTHHQKTVIVDSDAGNNQRKIIAFVGGLDLCDGRYDNPKHPLFRTLQTVHKDDYHNPIFQLLWQGSTSGCPREPWHDLHCKIDGPAAYDVLTNFEERWLKASKPRGIEKLKKSSFDDALLRIDRIPDIIGMNDAPYAKDNDPEAWNVQASANNLIPMEIALKIASKIKANERFSAYIVIPMWPEGVPTSNPIQRILFWQNKTMQMMYDVIYKALEEAGLENKYEPQDYLNFFCLGNREIVEGKDTSNGTAGQNTHTPQLMVFLKSSTMFVGVNLKGFLSDD